MSYIGLLLQTKLLATIRRNSFTSKNQFGEQVFSEVVVHTGIPCRKQSMREENIISAAVPTDMSTIKWLLFLPKEYAGVTIDLKPLDIMVFNRMPNNVTYFNVIHVEDATEEQHHLECILEEVFQT